jgi:DeoR/GlpR family transcriptional regulator of sugar metabolism
VLTTERRRLLLEEITRDGRILTSAAASRFGVSEVTIRSDLDELERSGRVARTHGGALLQSPSSAIVSFDSRMVIRREAKRRIALAAREFIRGDQTAIFDAGTTVMYLAQAMPDVTGLTVYTPGVSIAQQLLGTDGVDVHLLGGRVDNQWLQTVGSVREQGIEDLVVHSIFLGANAIDEDLDVVDQSSDLGSTKMHLVSCARRVILLADSSKWNTSAPAKVMNVERADVVITDAEIDSDVRRRLERSDVELMVV